MRMAIKMQTSKKGVTLKEAFEDFICEKKVMKLSEATIKAYEGKFRDFTSFFPADSLCSEITSNTLFKYIEFLQKRNPNIKTRSINTQITHLRTIFYNFMEHGYMDRFKIKVLKCEKELIETYSEAELENLWRKVTGIRPLRLKSEKERLLPIFKEVYWEAVRANPKLSKGIPIHISH